MKTFIASLLTLLLVGMTAGCFDQPEPTCEYWVPKLDQPVFTDKALAQTQDLGCKGALPAMERLFDDGQYRQRILRAVKQIGDRKGGTSILRKGLKLRDTGKLAASIVTDWKLAAARPELEVILKGQDFMKFRAEGLKALLSFEDPKNIQDLLIAVAEEDPNIQGIEVNQLAVEKLGEAKGEKAIPTLVRSAFIRDNVGKSIYQTSRLALARIGSKVIPALLETMAGKNEKLMAYARKMGIQEWEIKASPQIVQLITDTLDPSVAKAIVANMHKNLAPPLGVSEAMKEKWRVGQMNRLKIAMLGLGQIGANDAIAELSAIIKDQLADAVNQRLHSVTVLAMVGSQESGDAMMKLFKAEDDDNFRSPMLQPMALGLGYRHLPAFEKATKKVSERVKEGLSHPKVMAYLALVRQCKDDASCYIKKLNGENRDEAVKAAVMLAGGLGDRAAARDALIKAFVQAGRKELDRRRFDLIGLGRLGTAQDGEQLLKIAGSMDRADGYWKDELNVLGNWLKHRAN